MALAAYAAPSHAPDTSRRRLRPASARPRSRRRLGRSKTAPKAPSSHLSLVEAQSAGRHCDECGKWYGRGNRFRVWETHRDKDVIRWVRVERKLCTLCFKGRSAAMVIRLTHVS